MREKRLRRKIRHFRIRKRVEGSPDIPRLVVFRSNEHIYAQIIDDQNSKTIAGVSDLNLAKEKRKTEFFENFCNDIQVDEIKGWHEKITEEKRLSCEIY